MAKKVQRSFYLETDIFNYIKSYQDEHNLSSISIALERIIFSLMLGNNIQVKTSKIKAENELKNIPNSIKNIRNSMRD